MLGIVQSVGATKINLTLPLTSRVSWDSRGSMYLSLSPSFFLCTYLSISSIIYLSLLSIYHLSIYLSSIYLSPLCPSSIISLSSVYPYHLSTLCWAKYTAVEWRWGWGRRAEGLGSATKYQTLPFCVIKKNILSSSKSMSENLSWWTWDLFNSAYFLPATLNHVLVPWSHYTFPLEKPSVDPGLFIFEGGKEGTWVVDETFWVIVNLDRHCLRYWK